ncbi:MAG TPA: metalloregulator ArsR/SmtB family transcription factor [Acidimicrobiales bacterium]|nr:metalloregulator ArsR/SmtB family transcription factor [Acidimicrobiales bacterium]
MLGDGTRRAIFEQLAEGPAAVGHLASGLPVTRPAVSQHLKVLKDAGLVRDHRQGTRRIYEVDLRGVAEIRAYLDRFWDTALTSFKTVVEAGEARAAEPPAKAAPPSDPSRNARPTRR